MRGDEVVGRGAMKKNSGTLLGLSRNFEDPPNLIGDRDKEIYASEELWFLNHVRQ